MLINEFWEDSYKVSILSGPELIVDELLEISTALSSSLNKSNQSLSHFLSTMPRQCNNKIKRKRCSGCYLKKRNENLTAKEAGKKAKMVSSECTVCKIAYCVQCFQEKHS